MASNLCTSQKEKQLIVVSLPDDAYYCESFKDIECFVRDLAEKTAGLDDFLIVHSNALKKRYKAHSPFELSTKRLIVEESLDLWMRDFCPVLPKQQVKFTYKPKYLNSKDAKFVESEFLKCLGKMDIHLKRSDVVLDGGNVIDNNSDKVIISERICLENKGKSSQVLKNELENLLSAKVALVPDPGCTTGHADGIAAFIEDDVLLIGDYGDVVYCGGVEVAVKSVFPEVKTFRLPCGIPGRQSGWSGVKRWKGFTTAVGCYVNMLVTNNAVYVPQFNIPKYDTHAIDVIKSHTNKKVVPIDTSKLSHMGGSVRCMCWQIESSHLVAQTLKKVCKVEH